jgi:hypothetical protein
MRSPSTDVSSRIDWPAPPSAALEGASCRHDLNEFVLHYEAVRAAPSPDAAFTAFIDRTYSQATALAGWDRGALERPVPAKRR